MNRMNPRHLAPCLSFLLPGLGQLFQHRKPMALAFFLLFVHGFLNLSRSLWVIGVVALIAAAEAFRWERLRQEAARVEDRKRLWSFAGVGVAGGVLWIFSVGSQFLPVGSALDVQSDAEKVSKFVAVCRERLGGKLPLTLAECGSGGDGSAPYPVRDPWGGAYEFLKTLDGYEVRSWGRDKRRNTVDDLVFRFR